MTESICYKCEYCRMTSPGSRETRWEPAEPPDYECDKVSANFMSDDGCCHFEERDEPYEEDDYRCSQHSWYERQKLEDIKGWLHGVTERW